MTTYLDRIVAHHRRIAAADERDTSELRARAEKMPAVRGFGASLAATPHLAVIAEIKRRSPSKGDLNIGLNPAQFAELYEQGGASCLSVLTDEDHFGGSADDLQQARAACTVPVLRKDFTVSVNDVLDARLMSADCVLLIAAALHADELRTLHEVATDVGLDVLVEIHDEAELDVALAAGATIVGVNQRDLVTFQVDHQRACRMADQMPAHVLRVAESGVRGRADAGSLRSAGYHAVLVGESLVTSGNPAAAVRDLLVE